MTHTLTDKSDELRNALVEKLKQAYFNGHTDREARKNGVIPNDTKLAEVMIGQYADELVAVFAQANHQDKLIAERRGEKYQLLMLKHWMTLHNRSVEVEDIDHILESFKQFPAQPLARETLAALEAEDKGETMICQI